MQPNQNKIQVGPLTKVEVQHLFGGEIWKFANMFLWALVTLEITDLHGEKS